MTQSERIKDGLTAEELFNPLTSPGLTYNDLLILPGYLDFGATQVSLESKVTKNYTLSTPLLSSPMDTVTEAQMAIHMALNGGLGIIHHNCEIAYQAKMVRTVKKFENGFITDPICLSPTNTVEDVLKLKLKNGFCGFPVTLSGTLGSKLLGMVTSRDVDFLPESSYNHEISSIMTVDLVVGHSSISLSEANTILKQSKKGKLPIVDANYNLTALVSRSDLVKAREFPLVCLK